MASTIPPIDTDKPQGTVAVGLLDLSADLGFAKNQAVGFTIALEPLRVLALRYSSRLGTWRGVSYGLLLSLGAGGIPSSVDYPPYPDPLRQFYWLQPALNISVPIWPNEEPVIVLRGTLGPAFLFNESLSPQQAWLVPSVELAYQLTPWSEITIGGNSLIGWRGYGFGRVSKKGRGQD